MRKMLLKMPALLLAGMTLGYGAKAQYCTPTYVDGCSWGDQIEDFILTGASGTAINHLASGCSAGAYGNFTAMSVTMIPGNTYSGSITTTYSSNESYRIWIDFNNNEIFETSEIVATGGPFGSSSPSTLSVSIPGGATPGSYRMRVRLVYTSLPTNITPCGSESYGETHDYTAIIAPPPPCAGTPTAGTVSVPLPKTYCMDAPAKTLTLAGYSTGVSGITIQWQSSTDGASFTDEPGATTATFTTAAATATRYYRAKVTCGSSSLFAYSSVDTIKVNNPTPVATPASATICSGGTTDIALSNGTPGVTFSWGAPVVTGGTVTGASAGSGNVISQTLVNTGTTPATVTYTITGSVGAPAQLIYTFEGIAGSAPTIAQCAAWDAYRASLLPSYAFTSVNLKGTFDMTGRTVTDPAVATAIANALYNGTSGSFVSGGNTWVVGTTCGASSGACGGGAVELSANGDSCSCASPGYAIRPNLLNENWGGVNTATCPSPTQTVYVTIDYDGTCTATTTVSITVNPEISITEQPVATSACEGQPFTTSITAPTATSYQWYKDGGALPGATAASYSVASASPANAGNYFVVLDGCQHSDTVAVVVGPPITVDLGPDTVICTGDNIMLNAGNPGANYTWSTGDNTQTIYVNSAGTYSVTVTNSACTGMDLVTINEMPLPEAGTISYTGTMPTFNFTTAGTIGAASYNWLFGDGNTAAGPAATHTYTSSGTYTVMFLATNECGQSDTATITIPVSLSVGNTATEAGQVQVYPNPTSGKAVVEVNGATIASIEVVDNLGRVVMRHQPDAAKAQIDVKGLAHGLYTLRIRTDKGSTTAKLAVSEK